MTQRLSMAMNDTLGENLPASAEPVIKLDGISKAYPLFRSPWEAGAMALGLHRLRFMPGVRRSIPVFQALKDVHLCVNREERVGVIGRNGAGKTTLLRVITGSTPPTTGVRSVSGGIEALFDASIGFFPEFSGFDNIVAGMRLRHWHDDAHLDEAVREIVEFVELGDYLHQPIKNYSKGMRARLAFAVATSIRPDIVVIDEVLGAGDAYFSSKAARRMKKMLGKGCTLLLVSHSIGQVLQFCERVVWLEQGTVVMDGNALEVAKAYEEFIAQLKQRDGARTKAKVVSITDPSLHEEAAAQLKLAARTAMAPVRDLPDETVRQSGEAEMPASGATMETKLATADGVSRWQADLDGLRIDRVWIESGADVDIKVVETGRPMDVVFEFAVTRDDFYRTRYVILFLTLEGRWLSRQVSDSDVFVGTKGDRRRARLRLDPLLFGDGVYLFSLAVYHAGDEGDFSTYYDLVSRSFEFKVMNPTKGDQSIVCHPALWSASEPVDQTA